MLKPLAIAMALLTASANLGAPALALPIADPHASATAPLEFVRHGRPGPRPGAHRPVNRPGAHRPVHRPPAVHRPGYRRPVTLPAHRPRPVVVHRPRPVVVYPRWHGSYWRPGVGWAVGSVVAIGMLTAAAAAAYAPPPPSPGLCWYYTDSTRRAGYWDRCP
ncbi:hypothetical protein M2323_000365 [Rhodoblastus acidophilus]|uniref:hypothetical protein n=1 Tax=Rhodoblastus acidophilus TaxID=1074 RepID=UPI001622DD37|nr:hypothetical protein [Rhodoblastus acidophilus]MCW2282604.1 hypothetical protein [Rhodoblastus acidophilus]MCW2331465.1 hypothetical protein [Rhodoblastus acidophilus]